MKPDRRTLLFWAPTLLAAALRFAHLWGVSDGPLFDYLIMDAHMHDTWARGLLDGTWPGGEPFFRAPLYMMFLAVLYWIFPAERMLVQAVHVLVSALGAGFAARLGANLWGARAGWMAGVLYALLWTSIHFSSELLLVTLPVTLNLAMLTVLTGGEGPPSPRRLAAVGVLLGLSAVARPNILIVTPVLLIFAARASGVRTPWRSWAALLAATALPILPVTLYNVVGARDAVFIASQGGVNFYIGNNPDSDGRTAVVPGTRGTWMGGYDDTHATAARALGRSFTGTEAPVDTVNAGAPPVKASEVDRHYVGLALRAWREHPGALIDVTLRKLRLLIGAGERANNNFVYAMREWSPVLQIPVLVGWPLLLLLATLGAAAVVRRPWGRGLIFGTAGLYALSILLFFVNARFRLPVAALLTVPAGAGAVLLWDAVRRRAAPPTWSVAAGAVLLTGLSLADLPSFHEDEIEVNPFYQSTLGNAYAHHGDTEMAVEHWARAADIHRELNVTGFAPVADRLFVNLIGAELDADPKRDVQGRMRLWLASTHDRRAARLWYADRLLQADRIDESAAQYDFLLRESPDDASAVLGQAWILYRRGQTGTALRRFRSLSRGETAVQAWFGEGLCLIGMGRAAEAERAFVRVVDVAPDYWQAWGNLAGLYERAGRTAEAAEAYRRLLELKPDDARAAAWLRGR